MKLSEEKENGQQQSYKTKKKFDSVIIKTLIISVFTIILLIGSYYISKIFITTHDYFSINSLLAYLAVIISITSLINIIYWYKDIKPFIFSSMISGFFLRFIYTLFTDYVTRTHDVIQGFGHYNYIKYIAENLKLPDFNNTQGYHPPFHHILGAVFFRTGEMLNVKEEIYIKVFQFFMAALSCLAVYLIYRTLKTINANDTIIFITILLVSFHPALIMLSSKINNDNTLFFMLTLSLYCLFRWISRNTYKNAIFLALSFSFAVLTKVSGAYFIVLIFAAFLVQLIKNKQKFKVIFMQGLIFCLIATPISISYIIRNYIMFKQPINYVYYLGKFMEPSFLNTLYSPIEKLFINPFNTGGIFGNNFFWDFFLKSSSFGEFTFKGLENFARVINFLTLALAASTTVFVIISLITMKKEYFNIKYIMFLNLIIPVILVVVFRFTNPVPCSQDFRYVVQILISTGFFIGYYIDKLRNNKKNILAIIITIILCLYCFSSGIFILNMSAY